MTGIGGQVRRSRLMRATSGAGTRHTRCVVLRTADGPPAVPPQPILPEGEAILQPPLDNTPDDKPDDTPSRIPHLGHAALFLAITGITLLLAQAALLGIIHPIHAISTGGVSPKLLVAAEAFTYATALTSAWFLFPLLWKRTFPVGVQWNLPAGIRNVAKLMPLGMVLSFSVQALSSLLPTPKPMPMDDFFRTSSDIWIITAFGILVAPLFEEILFRGFLLPAFAIAYDWICLPRTEVARVTWQSSNSLTLPALVFSAVFTSMLFALLHGEQTAFTWPVLALLFFVSLVLTGVRIRLRSVAASTIVHASYNLTVFAVAFTVSGGYHHLDRLPH